MDYFFFLFNKYLNSPRKNVEKRKIYFFMRDLTSSDQEVLTILLPPSFSPLIGSRTKSKIRIIATIPKMGVIRRPHCQEPVAFAVSPPIMYPKPLEQEEKKLSLILQRHLNKKKPWGLQGKKSIYISHWEKQILEN